MLRTFSAVALLSLAGVAFAQTTQPGNTTPSITPPSDTPSVTPSDTPSVTPSQTPAVIPSQTPVVTPSAPATSATVPSLPAPPTTPHSGPPTVGGLSKCENMLGTDRDRCQQQERAGVSGATGSTVPRQ